MTGETKNGAQRARSYGLGASGLQGPGSAPLLYSRGIALLFHDHGTRRGWGVSITPRPLFTSWKDPVPNLQEAVWAPGPIWTGAENLASTGIRSPDRPARSQSAFLELFG
jgi:hypothetical protein